jgi:hypothetical protein
MTMTSMSGMNFVEVSEHRFPIQRNQEVYPVNMGPELLRIDPQPVVAVLTFDVGVIFNIGEDVQSSPDAGLREILSDGIDPTTLGTAYHPSETVNHAQRLFNTNYCCHDRNNLASAQPQRKSR